MNFTVNAIMSRTEIQIDRTNPLLSDLLGLQQKPEKETEIYKRRDGQA